MSGIMVISIVASVWSSLRTIVVQSRIIVVQNRIIVVWSRIVVFIVTTHGVLNGMEDCKCISNRGNGKNLVKMVYKGVLSILHDVRAWCTAQHETVVHHSEFKDQWNDNGTQIYFRNLKLMALLNRLWCGL